MEQFSLIYYTHMSYQDVEGMSPWERRHFAGMLQDIKEKEQAAREGGGTQSLMRSPEGEEAFGSGVGDAEKTIDAQRRRRRGT
jgi:hypothetical protein